MKPLFMWAGGKTKMIKFYNQSAIMPTQVSTYVEPFFGGGAMFLYVMERYKPKHAIINDINPSIVNIYESIKTDVANFIDRVEDLQAQYIPLVKEDRKTFYYSVRHQHAYDYTVWTRTREAATLYFLMKTGFNGIWQCNKNTNNRFGTPSGLLNQKTTIYDRDAVMEWHDLLQSTTIMCGDWRTVLNQYPDTPGSFYYLDPPYRGSFTSYSQTFTDTDQSDLVTFSRSVGADSRVILCNDDVGDGFFQNQCGHLNIESYNIKHTAGRRKQTATGHEAKSVTELAIHNTVAYNPLSLFDVVD